MGLLEFGAISEEIINDFVVMENTTSPKLKRVFNDLLLIKVDLFFCDER